VQAPLLVDQATAQLVGGTVGLTSVGVHPIKGIGAVEAFRLEAG
jgi:hypothetical protein